MLFQTFARTGALHATIKYFRQQGLLFLNRVAAGPQKGQLIWVPLSLGRACSALHNPWYAGAYAFGRGRFRKQPDGRVRHERLPEDQWQVLIRDAHPGYISWQAYQSNAQRLRALPKPSASSATPDRLEKALPYCRGGLSAACVAAA